MMDKLVRAMNEINSVKDEIIDNMLFDLNELKEKSVDFDCTRLIEKIQGRAASLKDCIEAGQKVSILFKHA